MISSLMRLDGYGVMQNYMLLVLYTSSQNLTTTFVVSVIIIVHDYLNHYFEIRYTSYSITNNF